MSKTKYLTLLWTSIATLAGLVLYSVGNVEMGRISWDIAVVPALILSLWDMTKSLRRGDLGVDLIAILAMTGALILGEALAAAVIALMYAGGQTLEQYAANRAKRELTSLLNRTPTTVERYVGEALENISITEIKPKDKLLIKTGAVLPVDGYVSGDSEATLDESSLTGESLPVTLSPGQAASSGTLNIGSPFVLEAVHNVSNSTYASVIRLVQEAQTGKAPFTRMADRYAIWFIPLTLGIAGLAWMISGDPVRALAVLVVATPCPLILAAPIAIVSGISSAARKGLLIKNGAALEALANSQRIIMDKTGTLTTGNPRLVDIETDGSLSHEELLQLAASLEQASFHVISSSIVESAKQRQIPLIIPQNIEETAGKGIQGQVNQHLIMVGQPSWILEHNPSSDWIDPLLKKSHNEGRMSVLLSVDHQVRGALLLQDEIRSDTPRALRNLRSAGIQHLSMASGDHTQIASSIGYSLGLDKVYAELKPEDKLDIVRSEHQQGITMMLGDGINDAPALAIADIGIAMGAGGAGASSEAADAVLMVERLDALVEGLYIARRSQSIAKQSVIIGMLLSAIAMVFAALGHITPLEGAILQEVIDVLVIVNALRALYSPTKHPGIIDVKQQHQLKKEHIELQPILENIRTLADQLAHEQDIELSQLKALAQLLKQKLIPHEQDDERLLHPQLATKMQGYDPMAMLSRTHREILNLSNQYLDIVEQSGVSKLDTQQRYAIIRILYSLSSILALHFDQENELYSLLSGTTRR
ncbi:heavy metal translocating P-type ATPase [Hydrogenovibrio marinus]|uniref:P-type Zn(2+) transporter n=1 Tax=Hydrogenovibrio marinus TaxID=28885 RepID=A0A066ZTI3_HYDMR|nr:heavy metal translocating P-type ATPase [Hydrogenovibrio marinus]KDN96792.1 hypothetical protein EI16_11160 [Hydrogenovibrio marinus]BBN59047.1 cation transporter [Hydrogenovibrio marinus]